MRYVELFCGAGGTSCGLVGAGWECAGAADLDATALATYAANFPAHPVHRLDLARPLDDALVASSPCTAFSAANSARDPAHAALTATLATHVARVRPAWVVFENVPRAERSAEFGVFVDALRADGYEVAWGVVRALRAQTRRRLVLLACRAAPGAAAAAWAALAASEDDGPATMGEALAAAGVPCPAAHVYLPSCDERRRRSIYALTEPAPTIRGYVRPLRAAYPFTPRDATHDAAQVFAATPEHTAIFQGFPPAYAWVGSKTARARCVGNAVPPPLARRVGAAVLTAARARG